MPRVYRRNQGGTVRFYGDLRDIGGGQVALEAPGERHATTDEAGAQKLLAAEIKRIEGGSTGVVRGSVGDFAKRFVERNPGEITEKWRATVERRLEKAAEFFGPSRPLDSIKPKDLRSWLDEELSELSGST